MISIACRLKDWFSGSGTCGIDIAAPDQCSLAGIDDEGGDTMSSRADIREGMEVYKTDGELVGTIERVDDTAITVNGQRIPLNELGRVVQDGVYLTETGAQDASQSGMSA
jgi:hypothetical protein